MTDELRAANIQAVTGFHQAFMKDVDGMIDQCAHDPELMTAIEHLLELLKFAIETQVDRVKRLNDE